MSEYLTYLAFEQRTFTSLSLMISQRRSCSICLWKVLGAFRNSGHNCEIKSRRNSPLTYLNQRKWSSFQAL